MSGFAETQIESLNHKPFQAAPSSEMYLSIFERLEREADLTGEDDRRQAHARVWERARQQGVRPIRSVEDLKGDFWPEAESSEDFLAWLRDLRQNDKPRSVPE